MKQQGVKKELAGLAVYAVILLAVAAGLIMGRWKEAEA